MIIKNIPRFLNRDDDPKLLGKEDAEYILNCIATGVGGENDAYELRNVKGTVNIPLTLPSGQQHRYVGGIQHRERNDFYYFIWNDNATVSVGRYNSLTDTTEALLDLSLFGRNSWIGGFALTGIDDDDVYLYFVDNKNESPIFKLNIARARNFRDGDFSEGYPSGFNTSYNEIVRYLEVTAMPPTQKPRWAFGTDPNITFNNLSGKTFQFKYRYVYKDGEYSLYSPISDIAVSDGLKYNGVTGGDQYEFNNNYLDVTVNNGDTQVDKIEIVARSSNTTDYILIEILNNNINIPTQTYRFYNDESYPLADQTEVTQILDAVPLTAGDIEYINNRAFIVRGTDGFNPVDIQATLQPNIKATPQDPVFLPITSTNVIGDSEVRHTFDFSGVGTPQLGDVVTVSFSGKMTANYDGIYYPPTGIPPQVDVDIDADFDYNFSESYIVQAGDTLTDVINALGSIFFQKQTTNGVYISGGITSGTDFILKVLPPRTLVDTSLNVTLNVSFVKSGSSTGNSSFYIPGLEVTESLKAGAKHPFGIIYYDIKGRPTTVNKASSLYVPFFSERNKTALGSVSMDWTLSHQPPLEAFYWGWVYAKNVSVGPFLQYSCFKAYAKSSTQSSYQSDNKLYISFNTFKGKDDSFKEQFNAVIDYQYQDGDRLRVISYYDATAGERIYLDGYLDFKIVGFELFGATDNPVYDDSNDTTIYQTTGYFLILEDPEVVGWSWNDVNANTDLWSTNNDENSAVFEIYRPQKANSENLYYEIGEKFEVGDAGLSTRYHKGGLRDQNQSVTHVITSKQNTLIQITPSGNIDLVGGDVITIIAVSGNVNAQIVAISEVNTGVYELSFASPVVPADATSITLTTPSAAGTSVKGDVWYKLRRTRQNADINTRNYIYHFVEDYNANDFIDSDSVTIGNTYSFTEYAKRQYRPATVWYGNPYFPFENYNGLFSINLALAPFVDYDRSYGSIQLIVKRRERLILFHENKVGFVLVGKSILTEADGGQQVALTTNVLNPEENFYMADNGIGKNVESLGEYDSRFYWIDIRRGEVCRLSQDGITVISDYKMQSYFSQKGNEYLGISNNLNIYGGFDRENKQYVLTMPPVSNAILSIDDQGNIYNALFAIPNIIDTGTQLIIDAGYVPAFTPVGFKWNTEPRNWETICDFWEDSGNAIFLEKLVNTGYVPIYINDILEALSTGNTILNHTFVVPTSNGNYYLESQYNINSGQIIIEKTQACANLILSIANNEEATGFTVSFHEPNNRWLSFYSFNPEGYFNLNNNFYSFKDGALYQMNVGETRNNFYGIQYSSQVFFYWNEFPSAVKFYRAVSIEGNTAWAFTFRTPRPQSTTLMQKSFSKREGFWYRNIPRARTGSGNKNKTGLGRIKEFSGNNVIITGFNRSVIYIAVGNRVFKDGVEVATITVVNDNGVGLSSVAGLALNDFLYVVKEAFVEGAAMRGEYLKAEMINSDTTEVKLFAVNVVASDSMYHN